MTPIVWETKERMAVGCKTVLDPCEHAGHELLMDFMGMIFTFLDLCGIYMYIPSSYFMFLEHWWYMHIHTLVTLVHTSRFWKFVAHTGTYFVYTCGCRLHVYIVRYILSQIMYIPGTY